MRRWQTYGVTGLIFLLALGCLVIGVWRGEAEIVFRKAVNICMECIGLD